MTQSTRQRALEAFEFELTPWVGDDEIINEGVYEITLTGKTINKVVEALSETPAVDGLEEALKRRDSGVPYYWLPVFDAAEAYLKLQKGD